MPQRPWAQDGLRSRWFPFCTSDTSGTSEGDFSGEISLRSISRTVILFQHAIGNPAALPKLAADAADASDADDAGGCQRAPSNDHLHQRAKPITASMLPKSCCSYVPSACKAHRAETVAWLAIVSACTSMIQQKARLGGPSQMGFQVELQGAWLLILSSFFLTCFSWSVSEVR